MTHNLKYFLEAAALVHAQLPQVRFADRQLQAQPRPSLPAQAAKASGLPIEVYLRRTPELIRAADCCLAVSGSVSLELLYHAKPTAILYWISPTAYWVQTWFRNTPLHHAGQSAAGQEGFRPRPEPLRSGFAGRRAGAVSRISDLRKQIAAIGRPRDPLADRSGRSMPG